MHFTKSPLLFTCLIIIFFAGCAGKKNELAGEWYINPYHEQYLLESLNEHAILRLYSKGIFTQFGESGYCTGTWKRNTKGNYLHLVRTAGTLPLTAEYLKIENRQPDEMTVSIYKDLSFDKGAEQMTVQFMRRTNISDADPFVTESQTWRIKPHEPEPDAAIRKRVKNYLKFLRSLYAHAVDNHFQTGNNWYPSPLRMDFGGGVRMAYSNEVGTWYKCFYDTAQATAGYQIISEPLRDMVLKSNVLIPERNLDFVNQLLQKIKDQRIFSTGRLIAVKRFSNLISSL